MWKILSNQYIYPVQSNIISFGAPEHTFQYIYATHLVNTRGTFSINVLDNVFNNEYHMKPEPNCKLALNCCGTQKNSITLNSPFGGINCTAEKYYIKARKVHTTSPDKFTVYLNNECYFNMTPRSIEFKSPDIRCNGVSLLQNRGAENMTTQKEKPYLPLTIKNHLGEIVFQIDPLKGDTVFVGNVNIMDVCIPTQYQFTVGKECTYETISEMIEYIDTLQTLTPITVHIRNNKVYSESVHITRPNISFVGETGMIHLHGSILCEHTEGNGENIVLENIIFHNTSSTINIPFQRLEMKSCEFHSYEMNVIASTSCVFHNIRSYDSTFIIHSSEESYFTEATFVDVSSPKNGAEDECIISGKSHIHYHSLFSTAHHEKPIFSKSITCSSFKRVVS